jgi:hypothetical protein
MAMTIGESSEALTSCREFTVRGHSDHCARGERATPFGRQHLDGFRREAQ